MGAVTAAAEQLVHQAGLEWPRGDPEALRSAAARINALAQQLGTMSAHLGQAAATTGPAWRGGASGAFVHALDTDVHTLETSARSHQTVATGLVRVAAAVEEAQQIAYRAAVRLTDARQGAATTATQALEARTSADTVQQRAAIDPTEIALLGNGPLSRQADQSNSDALRAEGTARTAQEEAHRAERSAHAEVRAALDRVKVADSAVAHEIGGLHAVRTASRLGGLGLLGTALAAPYRLGYEGVWKGKADDFSLKQAKDLGQGEWITLAWARKFAKSDEKWQFLKDTKGTEIFKDPTYWNESFAGRKVGDALAGLGEHSDAIRKGAEWFNDTEKATPVFRKVGIAGAALATGMDVEKLIKDGNPIDAFRKDPSGYAVDVTQTAFDASTTAFMAAPLNPVAAGAVAVTGVAWAGAEAWHHAGDIAHAVEHPMDTAKHLLHSLNPFG
jgi:hypothetical protein